MGRYKKSTYKTPNQTPASRVPSVWPGQRRPDPPSTITIHHWGKPENHQHRSAMNSVRDWLTNPSAGASAHEVIQAGRVDVLAPRSAATWHSGNDKGNATSYALELHPRASDGDYETAAQRIADLWQAWGNETPLLPHNYWSSTECPGAWDLDRLLRMARERSGSSSGSTAPKAPKRKSTGTLAAEVIDGKHGTGDARKRSLGSRYAAVQAEVNRRLDTGTPSSPTRKSTATLAAEVIAGQHGTGDTRRAALGSRYAEVQAEVNRQLLGGSNGKSVSTLADEVIRGEHGSGDDRRRSLGPRYAEVQREVNRRYGY